MGRQLKISKLADTLYSTMKDVLVFVMEEMAKESNIDFKFQMPKHTSFVGAIVKNVGIETISRNPAYLEYIASLSACPGKYIFDTNSETFRSIYRDTVLLLAEKGYLFDDDPELMSVHRQMKSDGRLDGQLSQAATLQPIAISPEDIMQTLPPGGYAVGVKPGEVPAPNEEDSDVAAGSGAHA